MRRKVLISILGFLLISSGLPAQNFDPYQAYAAQKVKNDLMREFLNKFSFSFTIGYGRNFYKHKLPNYGVINKNDTSATGLFLFHAADSNTYSTPFSGVNNWLNNPGNLAIIRTEADTMNQVVLENETLLYKGTSSAIPLTVSIHYNFLERFRIGGGFVYEFHRLPVMSPNIGKDLIGKYIPDKRSSGFMRYFGMVGGKFYQFMDWSYFVDFQFGKIFKYGGAFNQGAMSTSWYYNIGVPIEYEFSEYLRAYVRPSYEFKNYTIDLGDLGSVLHHHPTLFVHLGFRYNIPEIGRCPIRAKDPPGIEYPKDFTNKTCRIQKKHIHGGQAFRGQPFYKKQNPKIGENHPNLIKYKLFNRRKLSGGY